MVLRVVLPALVLLIQAILVHILLFKDIKRDELV